MILPRASTHLNLAVYRSAVRQDGRSRTIYLVKYSAWTMQRPATYGAHQYRSDADAAGCWSTSHRQRYVYSQKRYDTISGVLGGVYAGIRRIPTSRFSWQRILTSVIINKQGTFRPCATPLCVYPPQFLAIHHWIRYDTRCYFNVRSKADTNQHNLLHGNDN